MNGWSWWLAGLSTARLVGAAVPGGGGGAGRWGVERGRLVGGGGLDTLLGF
jgi:hypothetical protein